MICLGLDNQEKAQRIGQYVAQHGIRKVFALSPAKFRFECPGDVEHVEWSEIIEYKFFYRLVQEIDQNTLVVINECLRVQNRYDLTYNCIRHFLNQTRHQLIFQYLPLIDSPEDFMILFDFDTRSQWKREKLRPDLLDEAGIETRRIPVGFNAIPIETDEATRTAYQREKEKLITNLGLKNPHTIPRNLYLMGGKAKARWAFGGNLFDEGRRFIGRNDRLKLANHQTYKEASYPHAPYTVFEFCHNFIDFADVIALSGQARFDVLVADLKVDAWYFDRFQQWAERIENAYSTLQRDAKRAGRGA